MVEHHLAKVRVAGSNPVFRSSLSMSRLFFASTYLWLSFGWRQTGCPHRLYCGVQTRWNGTDPTVERFEDDSGGVGALDSELAEGGAAGAAWSGFGNDPLGQLRLHNLAHGVPGQLFNHRQHGWHFVRSQPFLSPGAQRFEG